MARSGLFRSLLGVLKLRGGEATALVDVLLLAALSEGPLDQASLDRLARALRAHDELSGVSWSDVLERRHIVEAEAPSFTTTRARLLSELDSPRLRRLGLALAAEMILESGQDQRTLRDLAKHFQIPDADAEKILDPWTSADPFASSYRRLAFDAPTSFDAASLDQALWRVSSNEELALLSFKLVAARLTLNLLGPEASVTALGELAELDGQVFRVDALIETPKKSYLARFLGPGEALNPSELALFPKLAPRLLPNASLLLGHVDTLSPADEAMLELIDRSRMNVMPLEL
ncbi:MAG: hypothetical protein HY791_18585 [Deltaproteobacteria bacterium]|nr:hypothetical protein [Deltaproteobacteria bacterium]